MTIDLLEGLQMMKRVSSAPFFNSGARLFSASQFR